MVQIDVVYRGQLRCVSIHGPSRVELLTDAPVDNHGRGESFSPTDLLATALGTCMLTTMAIRTRTRGYALEGMTAEVKKHMSTTGPRRIVELEVQIVVPNAATLGPSAREELQDAAHTCPVRLSLVDGLQVPVVFHWQD